MLRGETPIYIVRKECNMVTEKTLIKFGLIENKLKLKEMFKDNTKLKEIHIDIYPDNPLIASSMPFILLLRTIEERVMVENNDDRFIIKRNDRFNTHIINILFSEIEECYYKILDRCFEFILKIQNIYYRITVFN